MKKGQRIVPEPVSDNVTTVDQFIQLTAETLEAQSVALFVVDDKRQYLRVAAHFSTSDRFKADAVIPVESSLLGDIFRKAVPLYETYYTANPRETGLYGHRAVLTSYVTAPVGTRGLLWVDTRRVHGFSARHLRLVLQLARIAEAIPQLADLSEQKANTASKVEFFESLFTADATGRLHVGLFLDDMTRRLVEKWELGGAVIGIKDPERQLLKITSCAGFSPLMERGRIVRIKNGWVNWALENDRMVIITGQRSGEGPLTLFHTGENLGFDVKALVVVPWSEIDELHRG
ncbi:MAG: GAF domain-containing protein, partial [Desulfomonilaceae bacterium]